jgi:hypothetical protein
MGCLLFFPLALVGISCWLLFYMAVFCLAAVVYGVWALCYLALVLARLTANATGHRWDPNLAPFGPLAVKRVVSQFKTRVLKKPPYQREAEREVSRWQHPAGGVLVHTQRRRLMLQPAAASNWRILGIYTPKKAAQYAELHGFNAVQTRGLTFTTTVKQATRNRVGTS